MKTAIKVIKCRWCGMPLGNKLYDKAKTCEHCDRPCDGKECSMCENISLEMPDKDGD